MNKTKRILIAIACIISLVAVGTLGTGMLSMAEENEEVNEKIEIIEAENIGIKTIEPKDEIVEVLPIDETVAEDKTVDVPVQHEQKVEPEEKIEPEMDETEMDEEYENLETDPVIPEGMYEGYDEGVYFEVNDNDCEIHDECYVCETHDYIEELFCDEEINPEGENWVLSKTCTVCGHGECVPVDDDFVEVFAGN